MCFPFKRAKAAVQRPALDIRVGELRPNAAHVQLVLSAVYDIRLCKEIFDGWMTQLDNVKTSSKNPDRREQLLRHYLGRLNEHASQCSRQTNAILQFHVQFADLMARRMDYVAKLRKTELIYDHSKTTRLDDGIRKASSLLSLHVRHMENDLSLFVSVLEEIKIAERKNQTSEGWILRFLKSLFKVLAKIIVTLGPVILHVVAPGLGGVVPVVSALWTAASKFCGEGSEPPKGREFESIDSMILFLKQIVPREAQKAQTRLGRFEDALSVIGIEACMKAGRRLTLSRPVPVDVAVAWHEVAKRYQLALLGDKLGNEYRPQESRPNLRYRQSQPFFRSPS